MGGAQAIFALAYGTETIAPVDVDRRARQRLGPGGEAPGLRAGRDRLARRPLGADGDRRPRHRPRVGRRSTSAPRPSTAPTARWSPPRSRSTCSTRSRPRSTEAAAARARASPTRRWRWSRCPTLEATRSTSPTPSRPSTSSCSRRTPALLADRVTHRRLRLRRPLRRDRLRRLRRRLQPRAADRRRRPLLRARSAPAPSAAGSPRSRFPPSAAATLAPHVDALARAEGFPVHGESAMIRSETR